MLAHFGFPGWLTRTTRSVAVRAALATLDAVAAMGSAAVVEHLAVRIGIATGIVVAGDLLGEGAGQRACGGRRETPNLAARLANSGRARGEWSSARHTRQLVGESLRVPGTWPAGSEGLRRRRSWPTRSWGERSSRSRFEARRGQPLAPMVGRDDELTLLNRAPGARRRRAKDGLCHHRRRRYRQVAHHSRAAGRSCRRTPRPRGLPVLAVPLGQRAVLPSGRHLARAADFEPGDTPGPAARPAGSAGSRSSAPGVPATWR